MFHASSNRSVMMSSIIRSKSLCIVHLVPKRLVSCLINFWCQQQSSHHIGLTIIILLLTLTIRFTSLFRIQFYTFSTLSILTFNHVHRPPERTYIGYILFLIASMTLYWKWLSMGIISLLVIHVRNCLCPILS
jgi:hypothetical protein